MASFKGRGAHGGHVNLRICKQDVLPIQLAVGGQNIYTIIVSYDFEVPLQQWSRWKCRGVFSDPVIRSS